MNTKNATIFAALGTLALACPVRAAHAQALAAPYTANYTLTNFGSIAGVPGKYGGLTLKADDPNTLLIGGNANESNGGIYAVPVTRDNKSHITGFGTPSLYASAPDIDGGLAYGPGGVLFYTAYTDNTIGEIKPGSAAPDKVVTLPGVSPSVGSLAFVPQGFGGAGSMKLLSYNAGYQYSTNTVADGFGTYDLTTPTYAANEGGGPEGIAYIKGGNANFSVDSALVADYQYNAVYAYEVDANGDLKSTTYKTFISGLSGAEGAFIDPLTGDFLFSTFGQGSQIVAVQGFSVPPAATPEPGSVALLVGMGVSGIAVLRRRRK